MKLTSSQIDHLYTFTRQHFVEYYDFPTELVDHLANAIEAEWEENPKLSFEEVLNKEFKKFGVFGFMDVVEEKQKFLHKRYRKLIWSYYKDFFRLPKIILTLGLVYILDLLFNFFEKPNRIFTGIFVLGYIIIGLFFIKIKRILKQKNNITNKKWLFEDMVKNTNLYSFLLIPFQILNGIYLLKSFSGNENWQHWHSIPASVFLVLAGLFYYVLLNNIPKKISWELAKTYREYELSN